MAKDDRPDASVWQADHAGHFLCSHCLETGARNAGDSVGAAYRAAVAHLWRTHSLKRVWIIESRPELGIAAQMAFDLAIPHHTQFNREA